MRKRDIIKNGQLVNMEFTDIESLVEYFKLIRDNGISLENKVKTFNFNGVEMSVNSISANFNYKPFPNNLSMYEIFERRFEREEAQLCIRLYINKYKELYKNELLKLVIDLENPLFKDFKITIDYQENDNLQ